MVSSFARLKKVVPADSASWTKKNAHWHDSPFLVSARDAAHKLVADRMWPGLRGATSEVRVYGAVKRQKFFSVAVGGRGL